MSDKKPKTLPPQHQDRQPGLEHEMEPTPQVVPEHYRGSGKLEGKKALISGGDSGIGRSVAVLFAREGADVCVVYLDEHEDAQRTQALVEEEEQRCHTVAGDIQEKAFCRAAVEESVEELGGLDILVNNAAVQFMQKDLTDITEEQLETTFRTNIFSMFFMTQAAVEHMPPGGAIINSTSVTAFQGNPVLLDYSATKGSILAFTRALSQNLVEKDIRVNAVAPGPVWTPLIPASFPEDQVEEFGQNTPIGRTGQPSEVAPCYVFLASEDASYMTGQTLHPNGGKIVGA